jgi:hypothetical protein
MCFLCVGGGGGGGDPCTSLSSTSHLLDSGHHCLGLRYKQFLKNQLFWSQMASQHVSLSMLSLLIMFEPFFDRLKGLDQMA